MKDTLEVVVGHYSFLSARRRGWDVHVGQVKCYLQHRQAESAECRPDLTAEYIVYKRREQRATEYNVKAAA